MDGWMDGWIDCVLVGNGKEYLVLEDGVFGQFLQSVEIVVGSLHVGGPIYVKEYLQNG